MVRAPLTAVPTPRASAECRTRDCAGRPRPGRRFRRPAADQALLCDIAANGRVLQVPTRITSRVGSAVSGGCAHWDGRHSRDRRRGPSRRPSCGGSAGRDTERAVGAAPDDAARDPTPRRPSAPNSAEWHRNGSLGVCAAECSVAKCCGAGSWSGGDGPKRRASEAFRGASAGCRRRGSRRASAIRACCSRPRRQPGGLRASSPS